MTLDPIVLVLLFIGAIAIGSLLIYAKIIFDHRVPTSAPSNKAVLPRDQQPILISKGLKVYRVETRVAGEPAKYYLDIDDRIIVGIHQPSRHQYAGIRCVVSEEVLNNLAGSLQSVAAAQTGETE
jgi:hypothetical protein